MKLDYISDMLTHYPTHNHIVYIESNTLMIYCDFGCFKFTTFEELLLENGLYLSARVSEVNLESELFDTQKTGSPFYRMLSQYSKSISIGYRMKFKVIGLGWKGFYFKNSFMFKLGYSHLIFLSIPFELRAFKKKKKKKYHTLVGVDFTALNTLFHTLKHLRISDIYSMNGIFPRDDYLEFKEGKRSFML